jgi:hypothetical protein
VKPPDFTPLAISLISMLPSYGLCNRFSFALGLFRWPHQAAAMPGLQSGEDINSDESGIASIGKLMA